MSEEDDGPAIREMSDRIGRTLAEQKQLNL